MNRGKQVRNDFPGTARVMLSGQTNEDNILKIIMLTHEFISKPSTAEQIVATVERLVAVRGESLFCMIMRAQAFQRRSASSFPRGRMSSAFS